MHCSRSHQKHYRQLHVHCTKTDVEWVPRSEIQREAWKEESRKYRRVVFTYDDWVAHRSTTRYSRHLSGIVDSRIFRGLLPTLTAVMMVATFVSVYETLREAGIVIPHDWVGLTVEAGQAFNLTSFALSLLLVFRTNESYSRWLEARKAWSNILVRSRDFARQGLSWLSEDKQREDMLQRWTIAFVRSTMAHVREDCDLRSQLTEVLEPNELEQLMAAQHQPAFVLHVLSELVWGATLMEGQAVRMDEALTFFGQQVGTCERLIKTPIPLSYTRHTSRFLVMWLAFLPFSLWDACHWVTIPAAGIIAFLLLGIEEIGVQIEEPFGILPLEQFCDVAEGEIRELRNNRSVQSLVEAGLKGTGAGSNGAGPLKTSARIQ
ncbi:hypothetical protein WJX75_003620 [Coccomyxa subellipsoidea]|uniref:Uncharacterized protein n=1 Tax=Coccomyxa subellipsoidea TaxID=248742 RepID=A0ABR2YGG1_9CHLO